MRIGIVNDLSLAREALRRVVQAMPGHRVAWLAKDGAEAIDLTKKDRPDLILMDLIMPGLDGAEATRRIMADNPCPILVVTATVSGHMNKVYEAMGHGALDAVDTPCLGPLGQVSGANDLIEKIATVGKLIGSTVEPVPLHVPPRPAPMERQRLGTLVLLGASTGGPKALAEVLTGLPAGLQAAVIIVQHIDSDFAPGLAAWLGDQSGHRVEVVTPGHRPEPGTILLAGTDDHLVMTPGRVLDYDPDPKHYHFRPSVDVFFASVAAHWPDPGVAALLTGMLRDGAEGLLKLRQDGWHTIAQDGPSCVVWGMPKAAAELGAAEQILPVDQIARAIAVRVGIKASARESAG